LKKLRENISAAALISAAEYHVGRLLVQPKTQGMAPPIQAKLDTLKAADQTHHQKVMARMLLTGQLNFADGELDDLVASLARKALDLVDGDRADLRYLALFPSAPSEGVEGMATDAQDSFVGNIILALRGNAALADLTSHAAPIETALAAVTELRAKRDEAYVAEGHAATILSIARISLIDAIHEDEPRLVLLFPKKKRLVESFFAP
jgi:hypothetical protein